MSAPGPIVYFGTPAFAVSTLEALCEAGMRPALVVTQPARAVGRGRKLTEPPVAVKGRELELPVELVSSVRSEEFLQRMAGLQPWVGVVVAFGQIFPTTLLEIPAEGCINLHASMLPAYRGAAPIQAALAAGDSVTGVTSMRMSAGLDSGPVLLQEEVSIGPDETAPELSARLASVGARTIVETLRLLADEGVREIEQDHDAATLAPKLSREDGVVDWHLSARRLYDRWRAFIPWPGLTAELLGQPLKIRHCRPLDARSVEAVPGTIVMANGDRLHVACGDGSTIALLTVQRPNRAPVGAREFLNGECLSVGDRFAADRQE